MANRYELGTSKNEDVDSPLDDTAPVSTGEKSLYTVVEFNLLSSPISDFQ